MTYENEPLFLGLFIVWMFLGVIGYSICEKVSGDYYAKVINLAIVGACIIGPFMFVVAYFLYKARARKN